MVRAAGTSRFTLGGLVLLAALAGGACSEPAGAGDAAGEGGGQGATSSLLEVPEGMASAIFAGGCFWCMEPPFEKLPGVAQVISGYTGGSEPDPAYEQVSSGRTGHREAVLVIYDPRKISYAGLLDVFWRQIDPTDAGGQFADRGPQYRTAVFYADDQERRLAEVSREELAGTGPFQQPLVTEILPAGTFYPAEEYHQDYSKKNRLHYQAYRVGSGREGFLARVWGDAGAGTGTGPADEELRRRLTPLQYQVTQHDGTEPPFDNAYWNHKQAGLYVDVVSGEPLFSSQDKFDSDTGWPSFTRPLEPENIVEKADRKLWMERIEVRSRHADSHLGHVFDDGPAPTGLRYCINSAALRFIPVADLEKEGYGRYLPLFRAE